MFYFYTHTPYQEACGPVLSSLQVLERHRWHSLSFIYFIVVIKNEEKLQALGLIPVKTSIKTVTLRAKIDKWLNSSDVHV